MNNNLEFENEDPSPDSIEDNHPRTNYGEGYYVKETLEEAAENYGNSIGNKNGTAQFDFIRGAKWMQERSYSEEEVHKIIESYQDIMENNPTHTHYDKWFEQFKKK